MSDFPTALPNLTDLIGDQTLAANNHSARHNKVHSELYALATKVGVNSSANVDTHDYKLSSVPSGSKVVSPAATQTLTNKTISTGSTIDADVTVVEVLKKVYPVGCIYIAVLDTSPATLFGFGTWVAFGTGRTIVGVDSGQTEFDAVEETGGAKTHALTEAELPYISGSWQIHGQENGTMFYTRSGYATGTVYGSAYKTLGPTGGAQSLQSPGFAFGQNQAHNNLQPYITVHMWKRTA